MTHYKLRPAAPGELGDNVVMDPSVHPPRIDHAHLEIDSWFGDELIESYPCLFISDDLAKTLESSRLGHYELRSVEVSLSEDLPDEERASVPHLHWLVLTGQAGQDDIGATSTGRMVVSDQALEILRQHNIDHCDVIEYAGE